MQSTVLYFCPSSDPAIGLNFSLFRILYHKIDTFVFDLSTIRSLPGIFKSLDPLAQVLAKGKGVKIEFINDLISFEATTVDGLEEEFKKAVEHYLKTCEKLGRESQKAFRGQLNVRVSPELHRKASITALKRNVSLNKLVETAITREIETR